MKNNKVQIGPRISPETMEFYKSNFKNVSMGTAHILDVFPVMYKTALFALKGKFTQAELLLLLDISKEGHINFNNVVDSNRKDPADSDKVKKKLDQITPFQYAVLGIWASAYWHGNHSKTDYVWIKELG